jgi:uncharacterized protein with NAD-binding domain and iron-sulfur cluster
MIRQKVVIIGGGIAGMSAAHELVERGFDVEVFERKPIAGGKARSLAAVGPSLRVPPSREGMAQVGKGAPLPGEHGFRFFPGFYKHVVDTMARIPYEGGSVRDNLVAAPEAKIASFGRASYLLPAGFPRSSGDLKVDVFALVAMLSGQNGIAMSDSLFFATKLWQFVTSCAERRQVEYERINWWDFVEAESRSADYQKYFGNGITRSLVAAKARRASTKTIGDIFAQILFSVLVPGGAAGDRLLNGPTSDVWLNPWLRHLRDHGVVYHTDSEVSAIRVGRGKILSVTVLQGGAIREVAGDFFIGALPIERMAQLITPELSRCDPSFVNLHELSEYVEWMNGIQFYLTEETPITRGHAIYIDSPWALTSVSQAQFWNGIKLSTYADGKVRDILSVDISDWDVQGLNGKQAQHCSRTEIAREAWEQLKKSLNVAGPVLEDRHLHAWFLDPDIGEIATGDPSAPRLDTNAEPLLVNYVDTWRLRPESATRIPNFFLASDYVRTFTDLATMEGANEAARRAVNGILRAARSDAEPCTIWNLHEPELFLPLRAYDRVRFRRGLAWDGEAMCLARSVLNLQTNVASLPTANGGRSMPILRENMREIGGLTPALVAGSEPPSATSNSSATNRDDGPGGSATAAAGARASSDGGLRRLRIAAPAS